MADAKVAEIIDPTVGGWYVPLIHSVFHEEAKLICNLPLSRYNQQDKLIWRATTSGIFTVRSAYFIENDRKFLLMGEGSHSLDKDSFWKEIWSLKVSNPVKIFCGGHVVIYCPLKKIY
jgi:hypothetical protein